MENLMIGLLIMFLGGLGIGVLAGSALDRYTRPKNNHQNFSLGI